MRQADINAKKFHRGHYEIIAARFREALAPYIAGTTTDSNAARIALIDLAISMARRFQADNEEFSPEMFLSRCSPNPVAYPLDELWRDGPND